MRLLLLFLVAAYADADALPPSLASDADSVEMVRIEWPAASRRLSASSDLPEELELKFQAHGATFHIRVARNRALLPATFRHTIHFRDGRTEEGPLPQPCHYIGDVLDDSTGSVGLSTCGHAGGAALDGISGVSGLVLAHGRAVALEPQANGLHSARLIGDPAFLNRTAEIVRFARGGDAQSVTQRSDATVSERLLTAASTKYVEALVVNDLSRYTAFGGKSGLDALAAHSTGVMNAVTTIYKAAPTDGATFPHVVQVVLVGMNTIVDEDPWEKTVKTSGSETDCSSLLDLFNDWGQQQLLAGKLIEHDNRVLLSGRDFDGNTVGLAGVSAMCDVARSGNVNMCGPKEGDKAQCAAVVAHEMGHNFGMHHDSSNNKCPQSGLIMEAVGGGDASEQFSSCSVTYISEYFKSTYARNGECLENMPTRVFGDPVCGNGFVEKGEQCDCGASDCSGTDACCDGATCKFAKSTYECSDAAGPCCDQCMFVSASTAKTCRAKRNECDLPEQCPGGTADCPRDVFVYPGKKCVVNSFDGLCSAGKCVSLENTCKTEVTRDFEGSWDLTERCAAYNDDCGQLVCHDQSKAKDYHCGQNFHTHGKQMPVPEGAPCWFPGYKLGQRAGMCRLGACQQPHALAEVPLCGNGGIDFGEQCDCGSGADPCCECSTCQLKAGKQCSALEPCCDSTTCNFKAQGTVCRQAEGSCDVAEECSGSSGVCPADRGKKWGTACTAADGGNSTCYGKKCLESLDKQCSDKTDGLRPKARLSLDGTIATDNACKGLYCCTTCEQKSGDWTINGVKATDPVLCNSCAKRTESSTFTIDGKSNTIHLGAALDGSVLSDSSKVCRDAEAVTPDASCSAGYFLEDSIGRCLKCDASCKACSGPTNFDCTGSCQYGAKDVRGACPISADQVTFAVSAGSYVNNPAPSPLPTPGVANGAAMKDFAALQVLAMLFMMSYV
eukprot:TRINITY_DN23736_c0_g5_i1.p1 TRINITY_DN23736_c0_g5~~TRINITY_DN23736_c0_g5_i1.p1  ORF type:complete len:952 (+),score=115.04 TRINITY_DN23736_c0_g5_i1:61-2916(+)